MGARRWTSDEDMLLTKLWENTPWEECSEQLGRSSSSIYARAHKLGLKRSDKFKRERNAGQFKKGLVPWNKGLKGWQAGGNSKKTQFKRGHGNSNNALPVGSEKKDKYGILQRKVSMTGERREKWRPVKDLVYEEHYGAIPDGKIVIHGDGNRDNFDISNLIAVTRAELMDRNSFIKNYPEEYRGARIQLGWLNRKIKELENE